MNDAPPAAIAPPPSAFPPAPSAWWTLLVVILLAQASLSYEVALGAGGWSHSEPVLCGRHPLHLYHATLGAATFRERYGTACYDPSYQAGYPKTPVFDGGCRPAELALILAGPSTPPATAYRRGLWLLSLLAPISFALAARGVAMSAAGQVLAAATGTLLWWTPPVRSLLDAGDCELLLAGLMAVVSLGALVWYAREPSLTGALVLALAAALGWCAHPVVWIGMAPLFAGFYVICAPRHGPAWHLGLFGITLAGLIPNLWWLWDWCRFWWLRQPSLDEMTPAPAWHDFRGELSDWASIIGTNPVAWSIAFFSLLGTVRWLRMGRTFAAGIYLSAALGGFLIARLAVTWATLGEIGAGRVAPFALACLVLPAVAFGERFATAGRIAKLTLGGVVVLPALIAWGGPVRGIAREALGLELRPLPGGPNREQRDLIAGLRTLTTPQARILIEESEVRPTSWNWTALLAEWTERDFLGGLDPDACVEHTFARLTRDEFNGRPFVDWTQRELAESLRRWNIGWVLCRTPEAEAFWLTVPGCREVGRFRDQGELVLLAFDRPWSYLLRGEATIERIDRRGIVLLDVIPDNGEVILSLHHQPGFRVAPSLVQIATDRDAHDPIPMIRLTLPGPISRLALTWENR